MAPPVICIVGKKKSGKTTFMEKLLPELRALGISVGTIKHDAHSFEVDREGKDSWRHRRAGAESVLISSPEQLALIKTVEREQTLEELAAEYFVDRQLVVAEGFFRSDQVKVEVHRSDAHNYPLCDRSNEDERNLLAMVTDVTVDIDRPIFDPEDAKSVADLIARRMLGWVSNGMWS